jgi:hypothetical protein
MRRPPGCGIGYAESCMAEKDSLRPSGNAMRKWPGNGPLARRNRVGFLANALRDRSRFAKPQRHDPYWIPSMRRRRVGNQSDQRCCARAEIRRTFELLITQYSQAAKDP